MKLLGISGTIIGSKTAIAVNEVLREARRHDPAVETELLDLKQYDVVFCDGRDPSAYTGDTKRVIDAITGADFFVIGTPIFQASLSGPLKNVFDLIPVSALRKKVVGFVATGGTYQHYLVIENQLKPIAGFFRSYVAPSYVYLHDSHFNERKEIADPDAAERIERLAHELVFMHKRLGDAGARNGESE
ncbi:NADPH-dependent FMN reductase [Paenibacillus sp. GYB003]|uniref:NADPH-dependent FMN reductase n=1 Tax=Paenibacillus sp. GYB003 TaxID=2994392 RepID=UPI002F968C36